MKEPIDGGDHQRSADDVTDRRRQQIADKNSLWQHEKSRHNLPIEARKTSAHLTQATAERPEA